MEIMIAEAFIWEENARWLSQTNCPSYNNGNVICDMSIPSFHLLYLSSIVSNILPWLLVLFITDFVMYSNTLLLAGVTF
jgi:polyferredoxin